MFSFLRNILGKKSSAPVAAPVPHAPRRTQATGLPTAQPRAAESAPGVQRVETAQLQLLAIMAKFPDDLRQLVVKMPPESAMIVMPIPAILRFLPTGSVKISLASVVRQAPPGTFSTINPQDKRLVEVPLAEIFKRVSPAILKRRDDQRLNDLAVEGFDIFGDDENPHALAPRIDEALRVPTPQPPAAPEPVAAPVIPQPRVLQMPPGMPAVAPAPRPVAPAQSATPRVAVPPRPFAPPTAPIPATPSAPTVPPSAAIENQDPLIIAIRDLLGAWPEPIKSEASSLNGGTVALPSAQVGAGLARGKVSFSWGQIRSWMNPAPDAPTEAADSTELLLPLKVIAPAFLKHSRGGVSTPKKSASYTHDIPELFAGRTPAPAAPIAPPVPEPTSAPAPASAPAAAVPKVSPAPKVDSAIPEMLFAPARSKAVPQPEPVAPAPVLEPVVEKAPEVSDAPVQQEETPIAKPSAPESTVEVPAPAAEVPVPAVEVPTPEVAEPEITSTPESVVEVAPVAEVEAPKPAVTVAGLEPQSLAEVFNQSGKVHWSPSEIVNALAELPQIAGSVVALQEGLVIAHRLPEPLKGEVFAAFLPQIFARINQYSKEMQVGAVDDLLINSHGLPCHLFKIGQVYFAALGKSGEVLPTPILRLCAAALAS